MRLSNFSVRCIKTLSANNSKKEFARLSCSQKNENKDSLRAEKRKFNSRRTIKREHELDKSWAHEIWRTRIHGTKNKELLPLSVPLTTVEGLLAFENE
jgi:hypothetical protein